MCVWLPRRAQLSGLRLLRAHITQERAESVSLSLCSCSGPLAVVEPALYDPQADKHSEGALPTSYS